jgi:hypothetical protein
MRMYMQRDCPVCLAHLKGASAGGLVVQKRLLPDGEWHHINQGGRILHKLAEKSLNISKKK